MIYPLNKYITNNFSSVASIFTDYVKLVLLITNPITKSSSKKGIFSILKMV